MAEYKKHVLGEGTKGVTAGVVGAFLLLLGQQWFNSDLEYRVASRDAYVSAPLGQQGLSMAFNEKPLKNVSVVEFTIVNRTSKQLANAELLFVVDEKTPPTLVAGGVIAPRGMSSMEVVDNLETKEPGARKFRLKVVPKQRDNEYFHAVFVFEGERAPSMNISSTSGDVSIVPYQHWKDTVAATMLAVGIVMILFAVQITVTSFLEYFVEPRRHKKEVERFALKASELKNENKLQSSDPSSLVDAAAIYAEFSRPKSSRFWSKILPDQKYEY